MYNFTIKKILSVLLLFFISLSSFAEGSKDLYPSGAQGGRAYLYSSTHASSVYPFPTEGDHFVYVKAGEWIAMASSMQGLGGSTDNRIKLFDPYGNQIMLDFSGGAGNIPDRNAELSGPAFPGQAVAGSQYKAVYYQAKADGIYKVQFLSDAVKSNTSKQNIAADEDWIQKQNTSAIAAWDVSVCDVGKNVWVTGRVFTYVVNLSITSAGAAKKNNYNGGFYGKFKILTNDGYVYNVDNNGMNGIQFTFMVNNRGFHEPDDPGQSLYKSINGNDLYYTLARYHDPRTPDIPTTATDKIFYNLPDENMPEAAVGGQIPGQSTWLRPTPKTLKVTGVSFTGAEGIPNQMGEGKGGYINFTSSIQGSYKLVIKPGGSASFAPRVLTGAAIQGQNKVYFDGKDGNGNPIPVGTFDLKVEMNVRFAEVHFPFIDVEINPYGIKIELLKNDFSGVLSDIVYWDDEDIPWVNERNHGPMVYPMNNSNGISSNTNGHKWGSDNPGYKVGGTFGDKMGMDTWTYLEAKTNPVLPVTVKKADLKIEKITSSHNAVEAGDQLIYTVEVTNEGPSDVKGSKFTFSLPKGFGDVNKAVFNDNNCGVESTALTFDAKERTYTSALDLPAGCKVTYSIEAKVTGSALSGNQEVKATILRTNDISDPDATNPALKDKNNNPYHPTDAQEECADNGLGGHCNNMRSFGVEVVVMYAVPDINQTPGGKVVFGNVLANDRGSQLLVESATYLDKNGEEQPLSLGTTTPVYDKYDSLAGKITLYNDGSYTFQPEDNFKGDVPVKYITKGEYGFTGKASLEIKIIPVTNPVKNDYPIAQNDVAGTEENVPVSSNVLSNDSDPDNDNLTVISIAQGVITIIPGTGKQLSGTGEKGNAVADAGTLIMKSDGSYTFIPAQGFIGTVHPVSYTVNDGNGGTDTAVLFISVLKYRSQTFANDDAHAVPKAGRISGNVLANDTDPGDVGQKVIAAAVYYNGAGDSVTINGETVVPGVGKLGLKDDGSYIFNPDADFVGSVSVTYIIENNGTPHANSQATLYLTSLDTLKAPIAKNDEKNNQLLFTKVTIPVTDNDVPGNNWLIDPSTVSLTGPPGSVSVDTNDDEKVDKVTVPDEGVWTVEANGKITFIPGKGFTGNPTPVGYRVEDQGGLLSNEATITIIYNRTPPTATDDSMQGNSPGNPVTLNITDNDRDNNGTGIATATVNLAGPAGSTAEDTDNDGSNDKVLVREEGIWTIDKKGKIIFTPYEEFMGDPSPINYTLRDRANFESNNAKVTITYFHIPPVANDDRKEDVVSGTPVTVPVIINDQPGNSGPVGPSTINLTGPPGSASIDTDNDGRTDKVIISDMGEWTADQLGNIIFIPDPGFMGDPPPIEYTVEDRGGQISSIASVSIKTILGDNCFIPNNFTPNGDGLNDNWKIFGNNIKTIYVMVYNQYGQKIFEFKNRNAGWDGRYKGSIQPVGVYIYYAKITFYDGATTTKKGSITLIK